MKVRVSNLDRITSAEDLEDLFADFGEVLQVDVFPGLGERYNICTAIVEMAFEEDALAAIEDLQNERIDGRFIQLSLISDEQAAELYAAAESLESFAVDDEEEIP